MWSSQVHCLIYQKEHDDVIYSAEFAGLFFWKKSIFIFNVVFLNRTLEYWASKTTRAVLLPLPRPPHPSGSHPPHKHPGKIQQVRVGTLFEHTSKSKNSRKGVWGLEWPTPLLNSNQRGDSHGWDTSFKHQAHTDMPESVSQYNNKKTMARGTNYVRLSQPAPHSK